MYLDVAIPSPLRHFFTYHVPSELRGEISPGKRILVPFRNRLVVGFAVKTHSELSQHLSKKGMKEIHSILDETPIFQDSLWELLQWMSRYYFASLGEVCRGALPKKMLEVEKKKNGKSKLLAEDHSIFHETIPDTLTEGQEIALKKVFSSIEEKDPKPIFLHGITGSGKTEVYLRFLEKLILMGHQALFLVPEIGLTPQLLGRVQSRVGEAVAVYHSSLTEVQRLEEWQKIREGKVHVVVGTRSALFAPFARLGGIVIDEEHDSSYKQEEGFFYHARDVAVMRAKLEKIPIVLGSATPQVESFANAKKGKYEYVFLGERAAGATLPEIRVVDMRSVSERDPESGLSKTLRKAIEENLEKKEQTLLFLNRRGFAQFLICEDCGHHWECPNCEITLTVHHHPSRMLCHYCGIEKKIPDLCSQCGSKQLNPCGEGTERLEAMLNDFFPKARIARLDKDSVSKKAHRPALLKSMRAGEIDILVGTQMIAKGHDFPEVTLVGIVNADAGLHFPDFRSQEKGFQQLIQVAGRAGRKNKRGIVYVQTFQPEQSIFKALQTYDYSGFVNDELSHREMLAYSPFSRMVQFRFQSVEKSRVEKAALEVSRFLQRGIKLLSEKGASVTLLGPAPCPLTKIRGKYRWQLLLKSPQRNPLEWLVLEWRKREEEHPLSRVQVSIDVDPLQML